MGAATVENPGADTARDLLLPAHSSRLREARGHVERIAREAGLEAERAAQFVYAVNEAVTNAIRHGRPDRDGMISIRCAIERERLTVHVQDSGGFLAPPPAAAADAESGRGLALMALFADEVRVRARPGATTVSLVACLA